MSDATAIHREAQNGAMLHHQGMTAPATRVLEDDVQDKSIIKAASQDAICSAAPKDNPALQ